MTSTFGKPGRAFSRSVVAWLVGRMPQGGLRVGCKGQRNNRCMTSRVQEAFSKCSRKVSVDFPSEARGWICLTSFGLSADQRAIVTAKTNGELKFEVVAAAMRSCFPEFRASRKSRPATALLVQQPEIDESEVEAGVPLADEGPDAVSFDEVRS